MKADTYYMSLAIEEAQKAINNGELPFGACIVNDKGEIILTRNTCLSEKSTVHHAEINALIQASKIKKFAELKEYTIFSTSEPCLMCFGAITWARMSKVVYGTSIKDLIKAGFSEININTNELLDKVNYKITVVPNVMRSECLQLLRTWCKKQRILSWVFKNNI
ncbi:nucleoside deaminase [Sporolactobacillus shoreicorticis]|uniref:Nucleoside deaminase n=1 Tax=Sporolactobacillus shoreicorticis TaxID=1923877 RepID=A0ABW5S204_9BACL|nr:nucleoside deaminase [Sporolactobacillus shoreicorticis]MCO7127531.1 nucleoside deaminase [Sporolactobacillus shoreicorticis]